MEFHKIGQKYYNTYEKEDGSLFRGLLGKPNTSSRDSATSIGGLVLFTSPNADVKPGDVFFSKQGRAMLCIDNAEEETLGITQNSYNVRILTSRSKWERPIRILNPITNLEEGDNLTNLGNIHCLIEVDGSRSDGATSLSILRYKVTTNASLKEGDILDDKYDVKYVNEIMGVTVANVQKR